MDIVKEFRGKVAVITGSASGIGRATALRLAKRGSTIALADIDPDGLESVAKELTELGAKHSIHRVDVSSSSQMEAFAGEVEDIHGVVDILINNAGVAIAGPFANQRLEDLEWLVGINYWGVVYGCHYFLPLLKRPEQAHIVNVSSMFGFLGLPEQSGYCATKAAVRALSESLWTELRRDNIGVTSIHPGCIDTSIIQSSRMKNEDSRESAQELFSLRGAPPDAVAVAILLGIEKNKLRMRVRPESVLTEWLKRVFPVGVHRFIANRWEKDQAKRELKLETKGSTAT
ncbi:MAG TPA: SDR family NAD(P)-dependent oxidoreductase [Myxococcales bacterium]|nr:SDR family NAD(P)-dependent oxidoreductase [Myxococcales bacterium]HIK85569.1 SDR family NAD(P)-dependent oxidoreductase [Myxococcales bacterium]